MSRPEKLFALISLSQKRKSSQGKGNLIFNVNVPVHVEVKIEVFYFSVLIYIHVNRYICKHEVRNNLIYFYGMRKVYLKVISAEGLAFSSEQDNSFPVSSNKESPLGEGYG